MQAACLSMRCPPIAPCSRSLVCAIFPVGTVTSTTSRAFCQAELTRPVSRVLWPACSRMLLLTAVLRGDLVWQSMQLLSIPILKEALRAGAHHGSKQAQGAQLQTSSSHVRDKGGPVHASTPQNRGTSVYNKKIDLLSFDPLLDYTSSDLSRSGQQIISDPKERAKRDEFLRGLHDMFAATTAPGKTNTVPADTDVFASQPRTKRVQPKSRRLFQDRPAALKSAPDGGTETNALDADQIRQQSVRIYNLAADAVKDFDDDDDNDFFVAPKTSVGIVQGTPRSSESPRHRRSSSTESCLSCSEPSPTAYLNSRARNDDDDGRLKPLLPPIGVFTHKNDTVLEGPSVSSTDDIFGRSGGRAN